MCHSKAELNQRGLTLIEVTIAVAISAFVIWGAMKFFTDTEKQSRIKTSRQESDEEVASLGKLIQRIWNIRLLNTDPSVVGVPNVGFFLKKSQNGAVCTNNCAYLQLYAARTIQSQPMIDNVVVKNECQPVGNLPSSAKIKSLGIASKMNTACSMCAGDQLPVVKISSVLKDQKNTVVQAAKMDNENAIFPSNLRNQSRVNQFKLLGLQACFSKGTSNEPLVINLQTFTMDTTESGVVTHIHSVVLPENNFANIQLQK